jgi:hypothetical protein
LQRSCRGVEGSAATLYVVPFRNGQKVRLAVAFVCRALLDPFERSFSRIWRAAAKFVCRAFHLPLLARVFWPFCSEFYQFEAPPSVHSFRLSGTGDEPHRLVRAKKWVVLATCEAIQEHRHIAPLVPPGGRDQTGGADTVCHPAKPKKFRRRTLRGSINLTIRPFDRGAADLALHNSPNGELVSVGGSMVFWSWLGTTGAFA